MKNNFPQFTIPKVLKDAGFIEDHYRSFNDYEQYKLIINDRTFIVRCSIDYLYIQLFQSKIFTIKSNSGYLKYFGIPVIANKEIIKSRLVCQWDIHRHKITNDIIKTILDTRIINSDTWY